MTQTKAELLQTRHQGDIRLGDADSTHYVGFKAPATVSSSLVWTLPAADGSSNQYLKTDGSGALSWGSDAAGIPTTGGTFTGNTIYNDGVKAIFGTSSDGLEIHHSSNNSYIEDSGTGGLVLLSNGTLIETKFGTEHAIRCTKDAQVELYYDNSKKFETKSFGAEMTGRLAFTDNAKITWGTGDDLEIYHDGTSSIIDNNTGDLFIKTTGSGDDILLDSNDDIFLRVAGTESGIEIVGDGAVNLYHDNVKKFWTTSTGSAIAGTLNLTGDIQGTQDNLKLLLGGANDLQIYHDGSHNHIRHGVANQNLYIEGVDNEASTPFIYLNPRRNQTGLSVKANQGVDLYYDNVKKLETTSTGVTVTGTMTTAGFAIDGKSTQTAETLSAASTITIDCSTGNYFTLTAGQNTTFAFSNVPSSGNAYVLILQVAVVTYSLTWPSAVKWSSTTGGSAPTLTANKVNNFVLVTSDGGTTWRGSANTDYAS